jgi:hypothetical protein
LQLFNLARPPPRAKLVQSWTKLPTSCVRVGRSGINRAVDGTHHGGAANQREAVAREGWCTALHFTLTPVPLSREPASFAITAIRAGEWRAKHKRCAKKTTLDLARHCWLYHTSPGSGVILRPCRQESSLSPLRGLRHCYPSGSGGLTPPATFCRPIRG